METKLQLYNRTEEDVRDEIRRLSESYTPEWLFETGNPDAGSVIALLFAGQLKGNLDRYNLLPAKLHRRLTGMLGLSPRPACPARGTAVFELVRGAQEGVAIPAGTGLSGSSEGGEKTAGFETASDLYATASRLTDIIGLSGPLGRIVSVYEGEEELPAFHLFDFERPGIEKNQLFFLYPSLFHGREETVWLQAETETEEGAGVPLAGLRALYLTARGLIPVEEVSFEETGIRMNAAEPERRIRYRGEEFGVFCLEAQGPIKETILMRNACFRFQTPPSPPDFVCCGEEELSPADFEPFGSRIQRYGECCIGSRAAFGRAGALVTIRFHLSFEDRLIAPERPGAPFEPKLVRKKRPAVMEPPLVRTCAQETAIEYFNGNGWRKLELSMDAGGLFQGEREGEVTLTFVCPDDWAESEAGGFSGRAVRFRVMRADFCYMEPCVHRVPRLRGLTLSCSGGEGRIYPSGVHRVLGTTVSDFSLENRAERWYPAFAPLPWPESAYYFGFDKSFGGAPVGIFFDAEGTDMGNEELVWEYSSQSGFRTLRVTDHTGNLAHPGTVLFSPPSDFAPASLEGKRRYWLRLRSPRSGKRPLIRRILMNAVGIWNVTTKPAEEFYLDSVGADMSFVIHADSILYARVYVNEKESLSRKEMRRLEREAADRVRAVYDKEGNMEEFYVLWEEVPDFCNSGPGDRHYCLDRRNSKIRFGDGVNVRIPEPVNEVAFTVEAICCGGRTGNREPGSLNEGTSHILFIERIFSPDGTCGGSDIESAADMEKRGDGLYGGGDRLLSTQDFERAGEVFSDEIDKVKCISKDGRLSLALLLRDYRDKNGSFRALSERLKRYLLSGCEFTLREEDLRITEPRFVEISVEVWGVLTKPGSAVRAGNQLRERIVQYLEPVSRPGHSGWKFGRLPEEGQLSMLLSAAFGGYIREISVTASYTENGKRRVTGLDEVPRHPFCIGINGEHRIHISKPGGAGSEKGGIR